MSTYHFVSRFEDIDLPRMIYEAPVGTPYILAESKDKKTNKPLTWTLLVNVNVVLENPAVYSEDKEDLAGATSGVLSVLDLHTKEGSSWMLIGDDGRTPSEVRILLQNINKALNPKNTITEVSLGPLPE